MYIMNARIPQKAPVGALSQNRAEAENLKEIQALIYGFKENTPRM